MTAFDSDLCLLGWIIQGCGQGLQRRQILRLIRSRCLQVIDPFTRQQDRVTLDQICFRGQRQCMLEVVQRFSQSTHLRGGFSRSLQPLRRELIVSSLCVVPADLSADQAHSIGSRQR